MTVHTTAEAPSRPGVAASVVDATKVYGTGATEVAPRGLSRPRTALRIVVEESHGTL